MANIVFVTGAPGSGKTTIAKGVAEHFPLGAHLQVDQLREIIVSGFAPPGDEWTDDSEAQFRLARRSATFLAQLYAADGISFVIDDVCVPGHFVDHYAELFSDPTTRKVLLKPSLPALIARLEQRAGPWDQFFIETGAPWVYSQLEKVSFDGWTVLDTSDSTVEETIAEVVRIAI